MSVVPREKHIADLKRFVPQAAFRGAQPHEYWDVGVRGEGAVFTMRIALPPDFPMRPPVLQILQRVWHPNLDQNCVVHLPSIDRWNPASSNLGNTVTEGLQTLSRQPLKPVQGPPPQYVTFNAYHARGPSPRGPPPSAAPGRGPAPSPSPAPARGPSPRGPPPAAGWGAPRGAPPPWEPPSSGAGGGSGAGGSGAGAQRPSSERSSQDTMERLRASHPMPKPPSSFPRLKALSEPVLIVMKGDEDQARAFLDTNQQVLEFTNTMFSNLAEERSKNSTLAKQMIAKEFEFLRLKTEVEELKKAVAEKRQSIEAANQQRSRALRMLHKPSERRSDALSRDFIDSGRASPASLRAFVNEYMKERQAYHRTKVMVTHYLATQK